MIKRMEGDGGNGNISNWAKGWGFVFFAIEAYEMMWKEGVLIMLTRWELVGEF